MFVGSSLLSLLVNTTITPYLTSILTVEEYPDGIFDKPFQKYYDYIIVGAGSAGAILATRLSEDPVEVLLLEAGGSDLDTDFTQIPLTWLRKTAAYDWGFKTVPQNYSTFIYGTKKWGQRRGKVLGGTGSVNAMIYIRGNKHDFDEWAKEGCTGWEYKHVLPYFKKMEKFEADDKTYSEYRGYEGPLTISQPYRTALEQIYLQTAKEKGIPKVDCNGERQIGYCQLQLNLKDGERCSSSSCYLRPALSRRNLQVNTHSHVTKVLVNDGNAIGVNVTRNGIDSIVYARKEIILSGGVFGSPQLLMLSGIGPKNHLEQLNIPVVTDLPVGQMLQDHFQFLMAFSTNISLNFDWDQAENPKQILNYILNRKGVYARVPESDIIFHSFNNKDYPDCQITILLDLTSVECSHEKLISELPDSINRNVRNGFRILISVMHPRSRGAVTLQSTDPFAAPNIDPKYLSSVDDAKMMLKAIRFVQDLSSTNAWQSIGAVFIKERCQQECNEYSFDTDEYWICMIHNYAFAGNHQIGTCRMGSHDDPTAVVDPLLRIQGIEDLRVVEASVMRIVTSGNINAPTMMIAEKASDMIRRKTMTTGASSDRQSNFVLILFLITLASRLGSLN